MNIRSKLPDIGTTIFTIMTHLSEAHGAINLSQGFPDFDTHPDLIALVDKYMRLGKNQYAPMQGVLALREKLSSKVEKLYGTYYNPETEITITSGATEALYTAIAAVIHPGDEAIVFEPAYDSYVPAIKLNGGIPIFIELMYPDYTIDWDRVRRSITSNTRLIILNSPHNPTGTILSASDIQTLKGIVNQYDIMIISDEVYEHIIFDGLRHESMSRYASLAERSFVISSFGKTYHTTGWKLGYCMAPQHLTKEFQRIHQYVTFASNTPMQYAYAEYLLNEEIYMTLSGFYQKKRDTFLSLIKESRFKAHPCKGTYFQLLDYSNISNQSDVDFTKWMTIEKGVAAIPPSVFYHQNIDHKVLRICFAKTDDTLKRAAEILCRI